MSADLWMIDALDRRLTKRIEGDEQDIGSLRDATVQLRKELANLSLSFNALVELLVEDGTFSLEDLRARVNAGVIAAAHERFEGSESAQDAWDSAKSR
jgi:hypothetical protein